MTPPPPDSAALDDDTRIMLANKPAALLWMGGALLSFALMAVAGRELSAQMDTFGILLVRSIVGLLIVCALLSWQGWHHARTARLSEHLFRNVAHYGGQYGWFFGIAALPMAQVFAFEFTMPLWVMLLAVLFLNERASLPRLIAIGSGLLGMLIILRPGLIAFNPVVLVVLGSALCYAISHVATKRLVSTDSPLTVLFYMTVIQLPIGLVSAWPTWHTPTPILWPWVLVVGMTALSAHYCIARSFRVADASLVIPLDFLRLPLIALVGWFAYREPVDMFVFVGAAFMVVGNMVSLSMDDQSIRHPA